MKLREFLLHKTNEHKTNEHKTNENIMLENNLLKLYSTFNTICRNIIRLALLYAYEHEEDFKNWVKERLEGGIDK